MATFDGLLYDFQADGDFTLVRSTVAGDPFDVQIRTAASAVNDAASLTTQVAARVGGNVVGFALDGTITINGIRQTGLDAAHPAQVFDGGTLTMVADNTYQLGWAGGEGLTVTNSLACLDLNATLSVSDGPGSVQGLLGTLNGPANDLALPDGTVLAQPVPDNVLLGRFADAWRVAGGDSMLDHGAPALPGALGLPQAAHFLPASHPGTLLTGSQGALDGTAVVVMTDVAGLDGMVLANLAFRDRIDVAGLASADARIVHSGAADQWVVTDGAHGASFTVLGSSAASMIACVSDQQGGSLLVFG